MDFDISTLIYIAFIIISFFASAASRNKKKAAEKQRRRAKPSADTLDPPPTQRPTFEELLREFTGKKSEPMPELEPVSTPVRVAETAPMARKTETKLAGKPTVTPNKFESFAEYEQKEEEASIYSELFSNLDDVKKAFVASEVFKRKY